MSPVPNLSVAKIVKAFAAFGWQEACRKDSHIILTKAGNMATLSVPDHKEVARGTLRSLIRSAEITVTEFIDAS